MNDAAEIWAFIVSRRGAEFSPDEIKEALPYLARSTIRGALYRLVRASRLETIPFKLGPQTHFRYKQAGPGLEEDGIALMVDAWARIARMPKPELDEDEELALAA